MLYLVHARFLGRFIFHCKLQAEGLLDRGLCFQASVMDVLFLAEHELHLATSDENCPGLQKGAHRRD